MSTFVVTGGHHNSALVVAQDLVSLGHKVVWMGHRHSSRVDQSDSAEYVEVTRAGITFYDLTAARLLPNPKELILFPLGLLKALSILKNTHPSAIISFGGYLGGTVALAGFTLNIPIYLHEQTVTAGKSNKMIGNLSRKIFLTWPDSAKYFPSYKSVVVGLPLRQGILKKVTKKIFSRHKPTLLVMGGKQGAHAINQFIFTHLSDLLMSYNIVHQTGTNSVTKDYETAIAYQDSLGSLGDSYLPLGYISESEIGEYLHNADFYLGRSGAHISYELCIIGLRSILVPLMSTHDLEQHKNAKILEREQIGLILPQSELSYPHFDKLMRELKKLNTASINLPRNASSQMIDAILSDLK